MVLGSKSTKCLVVLTLPEASSSFVLKPFEGKRKRIDTEPNKIIPNTIMPLISLLENIKKAFQGGCIILVLN